MLKQKSKKILVISLGILLIAASIFLVFILIDEGQNNSYIDEDNAVSSPTKLTPTEENDIENLSNTKEQDQAREDTGGSGFVEPSSGDSTSSPAGEPSYSDDKKTVVYTPSNDEVIVSGAIISGNTENDNIFYRLIDDNSGVIGEGEIEIDESGDFSGAFSVDSNGSIGRLDMFSRAADGVEYSTIFIDIRFSE